ncbi:MAG TPA: DUF1905 domain-containing protein [Polyangia bacterium]
MRFRAKLFTYPGPGGWTFAPIPARHAPPPVEAWGRTPVRASVDGQSWETSVWQDKQHGCLLPVPKAIRGDKGDGDVVTVELGPAGPRTPGKRSTPTTAKPRGGRG